MAGMYFNPLRRIFLNLSGGTVTGDTVFTQNLSANTFYSAGTNLGTVIYNIATEIGNFTYIQPGINTITGGSANAPFISVVNSPVFFNITSSGLSNFNEARVVLMSAGTLSADTIFIMGSAAIAEDDTLDGGQF